MKSNTILEMSILMTADDRCLMVESHSGQPYSDDYLEESVKSVLHKSGLHISKSTGIFEYLFKGAKGLGQMFAAAVKGDKERVKELAKTIKKTDVIDFVMKLDQATMHLVTGPIHMIDALTGWHIGAAVEKGIEKSSEIVKRSIADAKDVVLNNIQNVKIKAKMLSNIKRIEALIPVTVFN